MGQRGTLIEEVHYHLFQRNLIVQGETPRSVVEDEVRKALRGKLFGHFRTDDHHLYQRQFITQSTRSYQIAERHDHHLLQQRRVTQNVTRPMQLFKESTTQMTDVARLRALEERVRQLEALLP